jgi:hypothetical protein
VTEDLRTWETASWLAMLQGGSLRRQAAKQVIQRWCVQAERTLSEAFRLSDAEIVQQLDLGADQLAPLRAAQALVPAQEALLQELAREGIGALTRVDVAYPECLVQHLPEDRLPYLLFCRGELGLLTQPAVGVLGSAAPSGEAQRVATDLAHRLVQQGHTLVGGYAKGIDRLVLDHARKEQGLTVVVLPMGIRRFGKSYGGMEQGLREGRILLLSPFSVDAETSESAALARLPLVAGLSDLIVLIEPEAGPSGWPAMDLVKAAGTPVCIWRGMGPSQSAAWVEAGATCFDDAGSGVSLVERSMGLGSEESAPAEAGAASTHPSDEASETEPLPFDDAESAIESLGRSGRVPDVLARRLRESRWD